MTDTTIQPVTVQQWTDALRSGEYEQVTGTLCEADEDGTVGYCCLGVLAKIAGYPLDVQKYGTEEEGGVHYEGFDFGEYGRQGAVIPDGLMSTIVADLDLAKVVNRASGFDAGGELMRELSSRNDHGSTFNQIADYIESVAAADV